jgi:hypothetical protein
VRRLKQDYEDQVRPRTITMLSKNLTHSNVAVGKDAYMFFIRNRFRYESRQNLGKNRRLWPDAVEQDNQVWFIIDHQANAGRS